MTDGSGEGEAEEDDGETGEDPEAAVEAAEEDDGETGEDPEAAVEAAEVADGFADARTGGEMVGALRGILAGRTENYLVALDPSEMLAVATFEAQGITQHGGQPGTVGRLMVALERLLSAAKADVNLTALAFGNSVELTLEPRFTSRERERIQEAIDSADGRDLNQEEVSQVVPSSVVRLEAVARILDEPSTTVATRARVLSAGTRDELRKLADALDESGGTLRFASPLDTTATVTSEKARRYAQRLREPTELAPKNYKVWGVLSRTDSEAKEFRLVLDPDRVPADFDGRRRHVEGPYTVAASTAVRDNGLWDRRVVAEVSARMEEPAGGGRPRPTSFTFLSVQATST